MQELKCLNYSTMCTAIILSRQGIDGHLYWRQTAMKWKAVNGNLQEDIGLTDQM